ncbi:MAG: sulfatase, partial [Planctomycetaceae bacterium]|nr:sulfatase [Planctomycetaceae bacterium]
MPMNISRRRLLRECGNGVGMLGLAGLVAQTAAASQTGSAGARTGHHRVRAKRLIFLFMAGGPSHVDLFDPKPKLTEYNGRPAPFRLPDLERTPPGNVQRSPFGFKKYGESGIEVSELFPQVARHVDDLCVIRSMVADNINHNGACLQMNTGEQTFSRPSMGSWLLYGLGTENQNLPGYVVVAPNQPAQGAPLWDASFLPASYQGTCVTDLARPIANLKNGSSSPDVQRRGLDLIGTLNRFHREASPNRDELDARIASFELAFRMQTAAPEAFDLRDESKATRQLYGIDDAVTETFGEQCLLARRLVERGVRVVQLYHNRSSTASGCQIWDQHRDLKEGLIGNCAASDRPIAGLLTDLKCRGLLDETLVVWGGEFGRTPTAEGTNGRERHPFGFTMWMAGGGVRRGYVHGATDELGFA